MSFQIKVIRLAVRKAVKYGKQYVGGVAGEQIALVLGEIDATLGYLGLEHWVAMEEFLNAAVRVGLNRQLLHSKRDSLNDRFFPLNIIETDAVLSMDDDVYVKNEDLLFAFDVWQEFPERIVGFIERGVSWENGKWNYIRHSNTVSIVLTSLSFFHKKYLYLYTYEMSSVIKEKIDRIVNCEDIAMNFLVSHITQKPPLKVTTLQTANCLSCNNSQGQELSKRSSHKEQRSECLNFFAKVYGYLPLFKSNYRLVDLSQNTSCVV